MTTSHKPNEAPRGMGPGQAARMGYTVHATPVAVKSEEQAAIHANDVKAVAFETLAEASGVDLDAYYSA